MTHYHRSKNFSAVIYLLFVLLIMAYLISHSSESFAENGIQVGRYTSVEPVATSQQTDVLSVVVTLNFNTHITTVGEALDFLLLRSGYRMASLEASDPNMAVLLSRPLPQIHRSLGPITVTNALVTLAGPAWELVVDPVNRLISFELLPKYRSTTSPLAYSGQ